MKKTPYKYKAPLYKEVFNYGNKSAAEQIDISPALVSGSIPFCYHKKSN